MAWYVTALAERLGIKDRLALVHATFEEEWPDAEKLVREQAEQLGVPLHVVSRGETLLQYVERRGKWPDARNRYCTSDFKRGPINTVITKLATHPWRRLRVLNVMGIRAGESESRAKRRPFSPAQPGNKRRYNGKRTVDEWLPIFRLSTNDVWQVIRDQGIPAHRAYDLGFTRLSCRICIFASTDTLLAAAWESPELFKRYVDVETKTGHIFPAAYTKKTTLAAIWDAYLTGERPRGPLTFAKGL